MSLLSEVHAESVYPGHVIRHGSRTYEVLDIAYRFGGIQIIMALKPLEKHRKSIVIFTFGRLEWVKIEPVTTLPGKET